LSIGYAHAYSVFFWTNDIDICSVVHSLADEWHVLEAKNCQVLSLDHISEDKLRLQIKATLSKDGADECSIFQVWSNFLENIYFGVPR